MRKGISKILVTGGAGFIGSAFVRLILKRGSFLRGLSPKEVIVIDNLTYAGDLKRLNEIKGEYKFYNADIANVVKMESIFRKEKPEVIVNFAAETHVDRSILDSSPFIEANIKGIQALLDLSKKYKIRKFIQISTDEVYGEIKSGKFTEDSPLNPSSPYSASKAAADLLIKSYIRTYDFPAIIIRPSNNYGPWQYPEKLIPLSILKVLRNEKVPVYAVGRNVREWLYVDDCARGILQILIKGRIGGIYNLGSSAENKNIDVVKNILNILKRDKSMIQFVKDRPGHDIRYRLNSGKIMRETGWKPEVNFTEGLKNTVGWYLGHKAWLLSKGKDIASLYK